MQVQGQPGKCSSGDNLKIIDSETNEITAIFCGFDLPVQSWTAHRQMKVIFTVPNDNFHQERGFYMELFSEQGIK